MRKHYLNLQTLLKTLLVVWKIADNKLRYVLDATYSKMLLYYNHFRQLQLKLSFASNASVRRLDLFYLKRIFVYLTLKC